jgi:uncharacterized tellurite resistance protein B-like protein
MGTIAQLFESGEQSANKGHFNNLVMLARVDGKVDDTEIKLLARMAKRLSLTDEQVKEIIEHSDSYPMYPPVSKEDRYERFVQLIQMIMVDGVIDENEKSLVNKYGTALSISDAEIEKNFDVIVEHFKAGKSKDDILEAIL